MASADQLKIFVGETLSPYAETRKAAEARLLEAQKVSTHHLEILKLIASSDAADAAVRQASAVHFKNTMKKGWDVNREDGNEGIVITDADRITIKTHLVQLMCTVPPQIQSLLSESISLIATVDFPENWQNLLKELVQQFNSPDPTVVIGVLKTADSIFRRFRHVQRCDDLYKVIIYSLGEVQAPLTSLFKTTGQAVQATPNDATALTARFQVLRLICSIFYSLNYQDLPEFFEDHMKEWMDDFEIYLQYKNPCITDDSEEDNPGPIDTLQSAIIEILGLYTSKDEEIFLEYLPKFTSLVWNLLMNVSAYQKHDVLATRSIKFLSSLVSKLMHKALFQDEAALRQIVHNIVIPNLTFRESDEERFEDDPRDFVMTEVEGLDSESRRKCSQDLLRAMCRQFDAETTAICSGHVGSMLAEYAQDPNTKWAAKDAAIHLMMGIAIKREGLKGVTEVNPAVNVMDFFQTQIFPELTDTNHTSRPVLKASAIKFISVFRKQFTREQIVQLLPLLIHHLSSPVVVVHTFAAYTIERILYAKDDVEGVQVPKIRSAELQPFLEPLFNGLFVIVDNESHNENDYVMKCVMRALATTGKEVVAVAQVVLSKLTLALARVAKNPRNPQFNHFLFESIAILVRSVCSNHPEATASMEPLLFEPFNHILQNEIVEFTPYVFQILAQLLEYRPAGAGLGQAYTALFTPLLSPALWEKKGNIPALARLMQAYIRKAAPELVSQLAPILGVCQKLLAAKATETSAFEILNSAIVHFPQESMESKLEALFNILMNRLQTGKTPRYTRLVTTFFALFVGKYSAQVFFDRMNAIQPGLGMMLVGRVWAPRLLSEPPVVKTEAKIQVVGVSKLLCDSPAILSDANGQQIWAATLGGLVTVLTSSTYKAASEEKKDQEPEIEVAYDAQYSRLAFAAKEVEDPFSNIADPTSIFVTSLHGLISQNGSQMLPLIQQGLSTDPKLGAGLESLFNQAGLKLA